jgi:hypothetical protein
MPHFASQSGPKNSLPPTSMLLSLCNIAPTVQPLDEPSLRILSELAACLTDLLSLHADSAR